MALTEPGLDRTALQLSPSSCGWKRMSDISQDVDVDVNGNELTHIGLPETETPEGLSTQPQAQAPNSALIGQGLLPIDPGSTTGRTEIDGSEESKTAVPTGDTAYRDGGADAAGSVGTMSGTKRKHEIEDLTEDRTKPAKELRRLPHIRIITIDSAGMSLLKYQHTRQLVVALSHGTCLPWAQFA